MGIQILSEIFRDRRTPAQKLRDRIVLILVVLGLLAVFAAGLYEIGHLIWQAVH